MIKDDDKGNKVCLTEKHFTLAASLDKEEGRKTVRRSIFSLLHSVLLLIRTEIVPRPRCKKFDGRLRLQVYF